MRNMTYGLMAVFIACFMVSSLVYASNPAWSSPIREFNTSDTVISFEGPNYNYTTSFGLNTTHDNVSIVVDNATLYNSISDEINVYPNATPILLSLSSANKSAVLFVAEDALNQPAGYYNGTTVVKNESNASAANVTIAFSLNVPIAFTDGVGYAAGNSSKGNHNFYIHVNSSENVTGIVVQLNSTGQSIRLVNQTSSAQIAANYTAGRLQYFDFSKYMSGEYRLEINGGTSIFNVTVWLVPLNLTNRTSFSHTVGELNTFEMNYNRSASRNMTFTIANPQSDYTYDIANINTTGYLKYSASNISFTHNLPSPVAIGDNVVNINFTVDKNNATSDAIHTGYLFFNLTNGDAWAPINLTLKLDLSNNLLVTVNSAKDAVEGDAMLNKTGAKIEVDSTVQYLDGGYVDVCSASNTFNASDFDVKLVSYYLLDGANSSYKVSKSILYPIVCNVATGNYIFNATMANSLYGGVFNVEVNASDGLGNRGKGDNQQLTINGSMLVVDVNVNDCDVSDCGDDDITADVGDKFYIDLNVTNYGNLAVNDPNVTISLGDCASVTSGGEAGTNPKYVIVDLDSGDSNFTAEVWRIRVDAASDCSVTVTGSVPSGVWLNADSISINGNGNDSDDDSDAGGSGTGELSIYTYPAEVSVPRGSDKTVTLKVKNGLEAAMVNLGLTIDYMDQSWYEKPAKFNITASTIKDVSVKFTVPIDAEEGNYSIKFVVNNSGVVTRATSKLIVTAPSATYTPNETQDLYDTLLAEYNDLVILLAEMEAKGATAEELAGIEEKLNETKDLLDDAKAYIQLGNYASAANVLNTAEDNMSEVDISLNDIKSAMTAEDIGFWTPIVVLVVIVAVVGFVIFISKPPSHGYNPGRGYTHVSEDDRGVPRAKSLLRRVKDKMHEKKFKRY